MPTKTRPPVAAGASARSGAKAAGGVRPAVKFRMRVNAGDVIAVGPGKISLLEAIGETGSLTAAAKRLDMSYRRAWMLLDETNRSLRKPAVDSAKGGQHGGGSELTELGRELIAVYRRIEQTAAQSCATDIKRLLSLVAR